MKLTIGLIIGLLGLILTAVAGTDGAYDMASGDACILQIMKESAPSLIIACGDKTDINNPIQAYSEMQNSVLFQAEAKNIFLNRVAENVGIQCSEYDNRTMYLVVCKKP